MRDEKGLKVVLLMLVALAIAAVIGGWLGWTPEDEPLYTCENPPCVKTE